MFFKLKTFIFKFILIYILWRKQGELVYNFSMIDSEKLMGNFIGTFETSILPTMTGFEGNEYPLIRTIK